jgi:predicted transcriptional regulator
VPTSADLLGLTAEIVAKYAARSPVDVEQLPELIRSVHRTLAGLASGQAPAPAEQQQPEPAVPIQRSVMPDYVVCLECGLRATILKRHLANRHGLTPATYRTRWSLPDNYPLLAPRYAERLAALAKRIGLGGSRPVMEAPTSPAR